VKISVKEEINFSFSQYEKKHVQGAAYLKVFISEYSNKARQRD